MTWLPEVNVEHSNVKGLMKKIGFVHACMHSFERTYKETASTPTSTDKPNTD